MGHTTFQDLTFSKVSYSRYYDDRFRDRREPTIDGCQIKKVIFNYPATIVFWTDGSKTVVKANGDDVYDPEKGLAMAISKKMFGNKGNYYNKFKKWLPKDKEAK